MSTTSTRPAACAGLFYPRAGAELRQLVERYLADAPPVTVHPRAIVVPHAGYPYSGPVAAAAYAAVRNVRDQVDRVLLLGPAHRVRMNGLGATSATGFETPLGTIPVDRPLTERLLGLPAVHVADAAHAQEHALEVQLPFLCAVLERFTIVPLVVGRATHDEAAGVIELALDQPGTLVVVSTDLSHFHDYETARQVDAETSASIVARAPERLDVSRACGHVALGGLLVVARRRGWSVAALDLRNSGDTGGPLDRVVGYGAYVFA